MADTNTEKIKRTASKRKFKPSRLRPWVQVMFLAVWLAPLARWLRGVPSCVFHCYACPLASFACPIGIIANFSAWHLFPFLAVGVVTLAGALVGSLICGWVCPFGFIQDLAAKIPVRKFRIPNWAGYFRFVMLGGAVILVPYLWGESHPLFICRICPAGAVEAGIPRMIMGALPGNPAVTLSAVKWFILVIFIVLMVFSYRPWCKIFCPLGALLAIFNRISLFHLRFSKEKCTECNTCRSRCGMGVPVEKRVNTASCIRCMECTTCGAIQPTIAQNGKSKK